MDTSPPVGSHVHVANDSGLWSDYERLLTLCLKRLIVRFTVRYTLVVVYVELVFSSDKRNCTDSYR